MKKLLLITIVALSINANAQTAYVPCAISHSLSVIDLPTNTVTATIPAGAVPAGITTSRDGSRVYVTSSTDSLLTIISTVTNTVLASFTIPWEPLSLITSPDGSLLYIAMYDAGTGSTIKVMNTSTFNILTTIPVGLGVSYLEISPDGSKVYAANSGFNSVSVINTSTNTVTDTIGVGLEPYWLAVSPDGSKLYVSCFSSDLVNVINTATNAIVATIPVCHGPYSLAVIPDGSKLYVGNGTLINTINTATNSVTNTINTGTGVGLALSPDGSKLYAPDCSSGSGTTVSVINTSADTIINTITVGFGPQAVGNFISNYPNICLAFYTTTYDSLSNSFTLTIDSLTSALATSYHWDFGDGTTSTLATPSHVYTVDTTYNVCLKIYTASGDSCQYCHTIGKDYLGHIYRTSGFTMNVVNGATVNTSNVSTESTISIYPNPFTSTTTITFSEEQKNTMIKVYDVLGHCVLQSPPLRGGREGLLDMSGFAKGIYFVRIEDEKKNVVNRKIVKQ